MKQTIAIIGAGNMGQAIAHALLHKKVVTGKQLILTNSKTKNNKQSVLKADIVILAIKPQVAQTVMDEIKDSVKDQLLISIMAGIKIHTVQRAFGKRVAIVRVMPNLGARVGKSMSVWVKNKEVTGAQEAFVKVILEAIGTQLELSKEKQINMATVISGSGPAYFFYLIELLEKQALAFGFSQQEANLLANTTLFGGAELLTHSRLSAHALRLKVASKGGVTEAALREFDKAKLEKGFRKGIKIAYKRAEELDIS